MDAENRALAKSLVLLSPFFLPISALIGFALFHSVPVIPPIGNILAFTLLGIGIFILIAAKWRSIIKMTYTFGTVGMGKWEKIFYRSAYITFGIGILIGILTKNWNA